jgi:UDP-N-acetylmuramoylalanine--D-glutamate ligase
LSSFQLETTFSLRPTAATVLNVTGNHLDRYASFADYVAAKTRIFAQGGVQVLNRDDPRSLAMRIPGRTVETFGASVPAAEGEWGLVRFDGITCWCPPPRSVSSAVTTRSTRWPPSRSCPR